MKVFVVLLCGTLLLSFGIDSTSQALASSYYPTNTESTRLDPGLSGSWFDPSKDGQGFTLQVINEKQLLATWFTYDADGNQAWMQGVGELKTEGIVFDVLNRYIGPQFGDEFDPEDRQTLPNGSMTLHFSSCLAGEMIYSGSAQFETENLTLERLTWLKGHECENAAPEDIDTYPPQGILSGAWYAPATDGQGWMIEILDDVTALVYWFTYDEEGNQRWMLGVGQHTDGIISTDDLELLTGPQFGDAYDSDRIVRETWGDLSLHVWPCDQGMARYLSQGRSDSVLGVIPLAMIANSQPCIPEEITAPETQIFSTDERQTWSGEELEGSTPYCGDRSIRWNAPVTNFDINLDGASDILLAISCYQGEDPKPEQKHNRQVIAAWRMFCSQEDGLFDDCTEKLFGQPEIRATAPSDTGGGNPYTHVIQQPNDINGDGYPDFWYALNRDDGRPSFNFDDPEDRALLESFCGPQAPGDFQWDCTRKAIQTTLLSRPDGTYRVVELPWGPRNTQAVAALPNSIGTYDLFAFIYGDWRVARLTDDDVFIDISETIAKEYKNIDAVMSVTPYVGVFNHNGRNYIAVAEVLDAIAEDPNAETWEEINFDSKSGFTVWEWDPAVGFELFDFFRPAEEDQFTYKEARGSGYEIRPGAYIRGVPVYFPRWHFFEFTQLHPTEEPVLVVFQESGSTGGDYFKAPPNPDLIYEFGMPWDGGDYRNRILTVQPVEAFYLRDEGLVAREQSVVAGDVTWEMPGMRFVDLNKDGYTDMYGHTGGSERPAIYINNKRGTLEKINIRKIMPDVELSSDVGFDDYSLQNQGSFVVRPLGEEPKLHFLYWALGTVSAPDYIPNFVYSPGEFSILRSNVEIDRAERESVEEFQQFLEDCLSARPACDYF